MKSESLSSIDVLSSGLKGRVVQPGDADYEKLKSVFYGGGERRPIGVVRVADRDDVARVISYARDSGVALAIRSGGHSVARHSLPDGGIVLDLRELKAIEIDPEGRKAWAETGLTAGEYTVAAGEYGLATGFGDTGSVGIGGITLAGGIGYLVRKHGMTIDDLLAAEIVTADGAVIDVSEQSHPDLFWAIRGGGGNFGVATRFKYRLHEVSRVVGGMLFVPATADAIASLVELTTTAPEELSAMVNVMKAPPMPFIPEEHHGRLLAMILLAYAGDLDEGDRLVDRLRKVAPPIADMVRRMSYAEVFPPEQENYHPVAASRTMFGEWFDRGQAQNIIDAIESSKASMAVAHLRALGGAMGRVPTEATAFAHRDRSLLINVAALYEEADQREEHEAWVAEASVGLAGDAGAYTGFLGEDGRARIGEAYPQQTLNRLIDIKKKFDPNNVFHMNHNIQAI